MRRTVDDLELRIWRANLLKFLGVVVADHRLLLRGRDVVIGEVHQLHSVARVNDAHQNVQATLGDIAVVYSHHVEALTSRHKVLHNQAGIVDVSIKKSEEIFSE